MGNTVFDQEWSLETKVGFLTRLRFTGSTLDRDAIEIFPIGIRDYGEAYLLDGKEKEAVLNFLQNP